MYGIVVVVVVVKKKKKVNLLFIKVPTSPPSTTSDRKVGTGKDKHLGSHALRDPTGYNQTIHLSSSKILIKHDFYRGLGWVFSGAQFCQSPQTNRTCFLGAGKSLRTLNQAAILLNLSFPELASRPLTSSPGNDTRMEGTRKSCGLAQPLPFFY